MLSRISIITQKTNKLTLLKCSQGITNSYINQSLINNLSLRRFSTEKEATQQEEESKSSSSPSGESGSESSVEEASQSKRRGPTKMFGPNKGAGGKSPFGGKSSSFQREPPVEEKIPTFEEWQKTQSYILQKEIYDLVEQKLGTTDKQKIQHFYDQLNNNLRTNLISDFTQEKILAYIQNEPLPNEKDNYQSQIHEGYDVGDKVEYSKYDISKEEYSAGNPVDTNRVPQMSQPEYEMYLQEQIRQLEYDEFIENPDVGEELLSNQRYLEAKPYDQQQIEKQFEQEEYEKFLKKLKQDAIQKLDGQPKGPFDFDKVSEDLLGFKDMMEIEDQHKAQSEKKAYHPERLIEDLNEQQLEEFIKDQKLEKQIAQVEDAQQDGFHDIYRLTKDELHSEYDQYRTLLKLNQQMKNHLITQVKTTREMLNQILKTKSAIIGRLETQAKGLTSDIIPQKLFDFQERERNNSEQERLRRINFNDKIFQEYKERKFDFQSKNIEEYNRELVFLFNIYENMGSKNENRKQFQQTIRQIIDLIYKNKVQPTILTKGKLGFLISYAEKYGVDIGNYNLASFTSPLEFYLNKSFSLNNVLIFTKYYTYIHECRVRQYLQKHSKDIQSFDKLTEQQKFDLNSQIFKDQNFVDMRSLFGFLVDKVGDNHVIDPITKEDQIWNVIEFFTKSPIFDILPFSKTNYNTISEKDIAKYFKNHLNDSKVFEKLTSVIMRSGDRHTLPNVLIQELKEYQTNQNKLPFSFDPQNIRKAYIRLRTIKNNQKKQFNEKLIEYFLYLFKCQKMWPEIIDLCDNYASFVKGPQDEKSSFEIRDYYLSDALLQMPSKQHYYELVSKAVFEDQNSNNNQVSAGYITAMTKAYLKDGTADHAIKFFQDKLQEMKSVKEQRENFLVEFFDRVYGSVLKNKDSLTFGEFKNRYLLSIEMSSRCLKESCAVLQLQNIIQGKEYEQIDALFQYYLVLREELQMLMQLNIPSQEVFTLCEQPLDNLKVPKHLEAPLEAVRLRKQELQGRLNIKDVKAINQVMSIMKDKKLTMMGGLNEEAAKEIRKIFNIQSQSQIQEIIQRSNRVQTAIDFMKDEHSQVLNDLYSLALDNVEKAIDENYNNWFFLRDPKQERAVAEVYYRKRPSQKNINKYREDLIEQVNQAYTEDFEEKDYEDPQVYAQEAFNGTLMEAKEQLYAAINSRKQSILNSALQVFNKVQEQALKTVKLGGLENIDENNIQSKIINNTLQKFDTLYNDPRSPIYSALQTIESRGDQKIPKFSEMVNDFHDLINKEFDITPLRKDQQQLESLTNEVQQNLKLLKNIQQYMLQQQQEVFNDKLEYSQFYKNKDEQFAKGLDSRIRQLFEEFKQKQENVQHKEFSRQDKIDIMRDVLLLELGQNFTNNSTIFPSFYCQDLIVFGLENRIPEAVRLGEKMMSENGYILSKELQNAVKNYLLEDSEQYQQAIKKTGPIDNTSLYKQISRKREENETPAFFCVDDPYWQDFIEKNSKRQHQWKAPSHLAWDHKPNGILGEVIDFKRLNEVQKQLKNFY